MPEIVDGQLLRDPRAAAAAAAAHARRAAAPQHDVLSDSIAATVASYLPSTLLSHIQRATRAGVNPHAPSRGRGVLLYADLVGLQMIPEVLEAQPELSEVITKTYCTMCEIVEEHGGDVVRLTGDSLLALWALPQPSDPDARWPGRAGELGDEEEIELREAVRAAAACALALQNELEDQVLWLSPERLAARKRRSDAGVVFAPTADAASAADAARALQRGTLRPLANLKTTPTTTSTASTSSECPTASGCRRRRRGTSARRSRRARSTTRGAPPRGRAARRSARRE